MNNENKLGVMLKFRKRIIRLQRMSLAVFELYELSKFHKLVIEEYLNFDLFHQLLLLQFTIKQKF